MMIHVTARLVVLLFPKYSQARLIRTLLIPHFRLICWGNLETESIIIDANVKLPS